MTKILATALFVVIALSVSIDGSTGRERENEHQLRLNKLETALELVLRKNAIFEERLTQLEQENNVIRAALSEFKSTKGESKTTPNEKINANYEYQQNQETSHRVIKTPVKKQLQSETVAFTAVVGKPSITNLGAGHPIIFEVVLTNIGGAYHNHTGIFTAPVSGVYVFNFAAMIDPQNNEYLELVKDGAHIMWNYPHASGATHLVSSSRTATVELQTGSEVWVRTQQSSTHGTGTIHGNSFTTFSGWLIAFTE